MALLTWWAVLEGGCAELPRDPPQYAERDSAGVRIVEIEGVIFNRVDLTLGAIQYELGDETRGHSPLQSVASVALVGEYVVVADGGSRRILLYRDGEEVGSFGREGSGPGEFRSLRGVMAFGADSVLAFDSRGARATVFEVEGGGYRTEGVESPEDVFNPVVLDVFADRTLLVRTLDTSLEVPVTATARQTYRLWRVTGGGEARLLATIPGLELGSVGNGMTRVTPMSPDGFASVWGSDLVTSPGDRLLVERHDVGGGRITVRVDTQPRPVDDEVLGNFITENSRNPVDPQQLPQMISLIRQAGVKEALPEVDALVVDDTGALWIKRFRSPGDDVSQWLVMDSQGRPISVASIPERFDLMAVTDGGGLAVGVWRDELDVQTVRAYRLVDER